MSVKVAVRCRPFNSREQKLSSDCIVEMHGSATRLHDPTYTGKNQKPRQFTFDHSFWSFDRDDRHYVNQHDVFQSIGSQLMTDVVEGYNTCVFAYGQTGAGKSYSMMGGKGDERGIIPRLCEHLFTIICEKQSDAWSAKVEVRYMEIYLEKVRDLLNPNQQKPLKVREHQSTGPYVEGLSSHAVCDFEGVKTLMDDGNKMRTVASTAMNNVSSRSHAIFQIVFTQTKITKRGRREVKTERVSKINLVDLAGSERSGQINKDQSSRLKEGNIINKSLSTLGKVISTLADMANKKKALHVPYRDSTLTQLLRESLGGNSKTIMLAAISPASRNYDETLSTLRYANQAKNIVNKAVVNEDATATMVRKLNEEIEILRAQLDTAHSGAVPGAPVCNKLPNAIQLGERSFETVDEVQAALQESESLVVELTKSWEVKLAQTLEMQRERAMQLAEHGILMDDHEDTPVGVLAPAKVPYLINLHHSPAATECLVYFLKAGVTIVTQVGMVFEHDPATPQRLDDSSTGEGRAVAGKNGFFGDDTTMDSDDRKQARADGANAGGGRGGRGGNQEGDGARREDVMGLRETNEGSGAEACVDRTRADGEGRGGGEEEDAAGKDDSKVFGESRDDCGEERGKGEEEEEGEEEKKVEEEEEEEEEVRSAFANVVRHHKEHLRQLSRSSSRLSRSSSRDSVDGSGLSHMTPPERTSTTRMRTASPAQGDGGCGPGETLRTIQLEGEEINPEHCEFHCVHHNATATVSIDPLDTPNILVNNRVLKGPMRLKTGDEILLSPYHLFRFDNPFERKEHRAVPERMAYTSSSRASAKSHDSSRPTGTPTYFTTHTPATATATATDAGQGAHQQQQQRPSPSPNAMVSAVRASSQGTRRVRHEATVDETMGPEAKEAGEDGAGGTRAMRSVLSEADLAAEMEGFVLDERVEYQEPCLAEGTDQHGAATDVPHTSTTLASGHHQQRQQQTRFESARQEAMYRYDASQEDAILTAVITNMDVHRAEFKLFPAYACYLLIRGCQLQAGAQAHTAMLLSKMATLFKMSVMNSHDLASRAYWFANCAELSMVLRSDLTLVEYGCAQTQQELAEIAREAHDLIVATVKRKFKTAPLALLYDDSAFPMASGSPSLSSSASAASTATGSSACAPRPLLPSASTGMAQRRGPFTVGSVIDSLDALWRVLNGCLLSSRTVKQLFDSTFYYIGAVCFNEFIDNKRMFKCEQGILLRYNLTQVSEWARKRGLSTDDHFVHIVQAAQLLQAQKTSLQYLDMICDSCSRLNSLQMERILCNYKPTHGEDPIATNLIDCIKGRFMASIDKRNLAADESLAGRIQLHRNSDFALPFRLSGEPHMGTGLVDVDLIRSIKSVMTNLIHAFTRPRNNDNNVAVPSTRGSSSGGGGGSSSSSSSSNVAGGGVGAKEENAARKNDVAEVNEDPLKVAQLARGVSAHGGDSGSETSQSDTWGSSSSIGSSAVLTSPGTRQSSLASSMEEAARKPATPRGLFSRLRASKNETVPAEQWASLHLFPESGPSIDTHRASLSFFDLLD